MHNALWWLRNNNHLYYDIEISRENFEEYVDDEQYVSEQNIKFIDTKEIAQKYIDENNDKYSD